MLTVTRTAIVQMDGDTGPREKKGATIAVVITNRGYLLQTK
ncbi:hypothetical protein ACFX59_15970 [Sphingomonas sp. NCPPB 2930]|nr:MULTISPECIES: hypothetical protein [unclassified Sphingomonas]MDR6114430.1 hypothetical protein [Sphingomonas sp. SORGH_AS_0789]MDR6148210.1 hypothetical protein [Sphingomonas sp. SORGH_AS_0742]